MARIAAKEHTHSSGIPPSEESLVNPLNLRKALQEFERGHISNVLQLMQWDIQETAKVLGIRPKTLQRKIQQYNLHIS